MFRKIISLFLFVSLPAFGQVGIPGEEIDDNSIANTKLEDVNGWTLKGRNSAVSGNPGDISAADIAEDVSIDAGDYAIGFDASDQLRKYDLSGLGGGGDGNGIYDGFGALTQTAIVNQNGNSVAFSNSSSNNLQITPNGLTDIRLQGALGNTGEVIKGGFNPTWGAVDYSEVANTPTIPSGNQIIDWTQSGAGTIDPSNYTDNDTQLTLSDIEAFGFVTGAHTVNTDSQTLSLAGSDLSISGGNTVSLPTGGGSDGNGIYDGNGALSGNTEVTQGSNYLKFLYTGADVTSGAAAAFSLDTRGSTLNTRPAFMVELDAANTEQEGIQIKTGTQPASWISLDKNSGGKAGINLGSGTAARDTNIYRDSANTLKTDDDFVVGGDLTITGTCNGCGSGDGNGIFSGSGSIVGNTNIDIGNSQLKFRNSSFDYFFVDGTANELTWGVEDGASIYFDDTGVEFDFGDGTEVLYLTGDEGTAGQYLGSNGAGSSPSWQTFTDTDTQLNESQVDTFVANNGYLTSEVDGSVSNEIQDLSLSGNTLSLSADSTSVDLSAYLDDTTLDQAAIEGMGFVTGAHTVNTDEQTLSLSGSDLSISGGNTVTLPSGGGSGTTISFFQVQDDGATGQLTTGSFTDIANIWATPTITDADFSFNATTGVLTFNSDGLAEIDAAVHSWNNANNRHELHIQLFCNLTGSFSEQVEVSTYTSRNNTQDEGGAFIPGFKMNVTAGDQCKLRALDVGVAATIGASQIAGQTYISAKLYQ